MQHSDKKKDVPRANTHAVEDIGAVVDWLTERSEFRAHAKSNLAVLHNRNDMTNLFRASNWISSSPDSIVSRGVTTCAGMTAHTLIIAQTRVGFLTGGRKKYFFALPEDEQMVQLEEAYARATVTRARALCLIMGRLDMKGLLGAATVMGTLMYGAGHVRAGHAHFYLHDHELSRSPLDESFIDMLKQNCCLSGPHFPPPAIVEALQDYVTNYHKVRRLHLIVVDLWRPWKYNTARAREITVPEAVRSTSCTEVVYKIRQWSLPGATVVPVLNVSSRVFWLELDDKALLDSYTVLQEGILCDVFSQKCSAAWQGAPGQRLTVAIMLPGRQDADDWLNFMLSQKNLWPTFATRGTLTEEIPEQTFRKERRRLQAKHMDGGQAELARVGWPDVHLCPYWEVT